MPLFRLTPLKITWNHAEAIVSNLLKHRFVPSGGHNGLRSAETYLVQFNYDIPRMPYRLASHPSIGPVVRSFGLQRFKD